MFIDEGTGAPSGRDHDEYESARFRESPNEDEQVPLRELKMILRGAFLAENNMVVSVVFFRTLTYKNSNTRMISLKLE